MLRYVGRGSLGRKPLGINLSSMNTLELKIPPPVVMLIGGLFMWAISLSTFSIDISFFTRVIVSVAIALVGLGISVSGVIVFLAARTTTNPMKPESASSLVTVGIYRVTRNPMYVGLFVMLVGWAVFLAAPWSLVGPIAFVLFISRFQITPEEGVLESIFGEAYGNYKARVRRWL